MIRFLITTAGLALALPALVEVGFRNEWLADRPSFLYETTWVVALFTAIIFIYLYRLGKAGYFVQFYVLSIALKMLSFLGYNVFIVVHAPSESVPNVLYFLVTYFLFTAVEIGFLYRRISGDTHP